ncbi:MAG: hypothetical protein KGL39_05780 [Patescibacteria group bacterium]|nr:hypothetical protein [Patescibacteria group bacterium]
MNYDAQTGEQLPQNLGIAEMEKTMNLSCRAFISHSVSGDTYVAEYANEDSDEIIAICGPLHHSEYRDEDGQLKSTEDFNFETEDVEWANKQPWTMVR